MSSVFVAISSNEPLVPESDGPDLRPFLPFESQNSTVWTGPGQTSRIRCWSVLEEAARGGFWAGEGEEMLVYDGWLVEDRSVNLEQTVARGLLETVEPADVASMCGTTAGEFSLVYGSGDELEATTDFLGSRHLYYGQKDGRAVVSNRAMVAAGVLFDGELPAKNPAFFGWLLSSLAAPLGRETPWASIQLLGPGEAISLGDGRARIQTAFEAPVGDEAVDWAKLSDEFADRCRQIDRFPELKFRLGLTGGKDSRLVLSGLAKAGVLDAVDFAYLRARPGHSDLRVGPRLAEQYGVDFQRIEPADDGTELFDQIDRHNFQTEYALNAWDLKGVDSRRPGGKIHGNLGETFRGHAKPKFALGWRWIENHYCSDGYIDPPGLMEPAVRAHLSGVFGRWLDERRDDDHPRLRVNDAVHRVGRMQRWVGQAQLADGCGVLAINPIPSPMLFEAYRHLGLRDRQGERIHFELMRGCDDWLWRQSFADARWSPLLGPSALAGGSPVTGEGGGPSPQINRWKRRREDICEYLMEAGTTSFFDLVDRDRLHDFVGAVGDEPDFETLRTIWGLLGIRRALDEPFESIPISMEG